MIQSAGILAAALLVRALAFGHGDLAHIYGVVTAIDDHSISVKTADGSIKVVAFDGETHFLKAGAPATVKDLAIGNRVVIHAHKNGDKFHAAEIKIGMTT